MSEEKKLTDEEIVKALEVCMSGEGCEGCPYFENGTDCVRRSEKDTLDFIHRLQSENKGLKERGEIVINNLHETIDKQKAEIERLKTFIDFKTANVMCEKCKEKAVKDTAKGILRTIKFNGILEYGGYVIHDSTIKSISDCYGVEVE